MTGTSLTQRWATPRARRRTRSAHRPAAPSAGDRTSSGGASWPPDDTAGAPGWPRSRCERRQGHADPSSPELRTPTFTCNSDWIFFPAFTNCWEVLFATCWGNTGLDCNRNTLLRPGAELNTNMRMNGVGLWRGQGVKKPHESLWPSVFSPKHKPLGYLNGRNQTRLLGKPHTPFNSL